MPPLQLATAPVYRTGEVPEITAHLSYSRSREITAVEFTLVLTVGSTKKAVTQTFPMQTDQPVATDESGREWSITARPFGYPCLPNIEAGGASLRWSVEAKVSSRLRPGAYVQVPRHSPEDELSQRIALPVERGDVATVVEEAAPKTLGKFEMILFLLLGGAAILWITVGVVVLPQIVRVGVLLFVAVYLLEYYFTRKHLTKDLTTTVNDLPGQEGMQMQFHTPSGNDTFRRGSIIVNTMLLHPRLGKKNRVEIGRKELQKDTYSVTESARSTKTGTLVDLPVTNGLLPTATIRSHYGIRYTVHYVYRRPFWLNVRLNFEPAVTVNDPRRKGQQALPPYAHSGIG